ncbi:MAG TPA: glycosyltransferase family 4 protein [Verrucomicrobiae bacterium]|nr:glycosyltransferase family 4 protein [Verrucomicrobiae bacterium]
MRIAQIAPLYESVPPKLYGGTERVVSYLTEELVRLGHDVTLFASGDSKTSANLVSGCKTALRLNRTCRDPLAHHTVLMGKVLSMADEFDVLHFHTDYLHFPATGSLGLPVVTTLHGRLDLPDLVPVYEHFDKQPIVSISQSQRRPLARAHWIGNVYHGLPMNLCRAQLNKGDYLAFLGRISPEKRPDRAIRIAVKAGMPLKIAAKVDPVDREYFETEIVPLLNEPGVEFLGEINEAQKSAFLGRAYAYLFPIDWPEPFGLTMIEAMACGTPIIAFRCGSVPELIDDGVTGFIVDSEDAAVEALKNVETLQRSRIRATFERRFTACRMAKDYLSIYEFLVDAPPLSRAVQSIELSSTIVS